MCVVVCGNDRFEILLRHSNVILSEPYRFYLQEVLPNNYIQYEDTDPHEENGAHFKATFKKISFKHSDTGWYGCMNLGDINGVSNLPSANPRAKTHKPNWRYLFIKCKIKFLMLTLKSI